MLQWQLFVIERDIWRSENILIEFCARRAQFETRTEVQALLSRFLCSVLLFRHMPDGTVKGNTTASFHMSITLVTMN